MRKPLRRESRTLEENLLLSTLLSHLAKQRVKAKVLDIAGLDSEEVEKALNEALKKLAEYYVQDNMQIARVQRVQLI